MRLRISPRAEKELKKISKIQQIIIAKKIRSFTTAQNLNKEKLSGYKNIYRVGVGNYRIVYRQTSDECYIILIGHRKDIYSMLSKVFK